MTKTNALRLLLVATVLGWVAGGHRAAADAAPIEAFFGDYVGRTISSDEGGLSKRDLSVSIHPENGGFTVDWTTIIHKPGGKAKRKAYSIDFRPSGRQNIYAAAMKSNMFGGRVPLDPMKGEPYVWARIAGDTLTVSALLITDDGGYEIQVYDRTLTDTGLALRFSRVRDGRRLKLVTGTLSRVGD